MASTRLDLRNLIRRELGDTVATYLWSDQQLNDDLAAAFGWYSQYFPVLTAGTSTSGANQTALLLGAGVARVDSVTLDGATVPWVPDLETLYEPALRADQSQTYVQPIAPYGSQGSHAQAWTYDAITASVIFRFALAAGRAVVVRYAVNHVLPGDDVTAVTVPDVDAELVVLYACDRLVQSQHTDAVKRGAPGAWADARQDRGYAQRWRAGLAARRRHMTTGWMQAPQ